MKKILVSIFKFLDNLIQKQNIKIIKNELGKKINIYIDVGAHKGEMIDILLKHFKISKIYAFEPNPESFNFFKKKKIKKIKLFNYALGEKNKFEYLKVGHISAMSTINKINPNSIYTFLKKMIIFIFFGEFKIYKKEIRVKKIKMKDIYKSFKGKKIDLLKIDTQGNELNVLKGSKKILKNIKFIKLELMLYDYYEKSYSISEIDSFLMKYNFKIFNIIEVNQNPVNYKTDWIEVLYYNTKFKL